MKVGDHVKVRIEEEKQCFPPDGILVARVQEIFEPGTEREDYLIRWQCRPSIHGNTIIKPEDILEVIPAN